MRQRRTVLPGLGLLFAVVAVTACSGRVATVPDPGGPDRTASDVDGRLEDDLVDPVARFDRPSDGAGARGPVRPPGRDATTGAAASEPAPAAGSPLPADIVFVAGDRLCTVLHDGSGQRCTEAFASYLNAPTWSSGGDRLAASASVDGSTHIHTALPDGSGRSRITSGDFSAFSPAWSRHGVIAFEGVDEVACVKPCVTETDIYTVRSDGSGQKRLTSEPELEFAPDWSPDGGTIVFSCGADPGTQLCLIDADGTNRRVLPIERFTVAAYARWSPDGGRIAFVGSRTENPSFGDVDLWTVNPEGRDPRQLTTTADIGPDFDWAPEGDLIAFVSDPDFPGTGLYHSLGVVGADGSGRRALVTGAEVQDPDWAPDGRSLVYADTSYPNAVYVIGGDGSGRTAVGDGGIEPAWRP